MFKITKINERDIFEDILLESHYFPKEQDLIDYEAYDVDSMRQKLLSNFDRSKVVYAIKWENELFGIMGIKEYAPRIGNIYLTSKKIQNEQALDFFKKGRKIISEEKEIYDLLYNRVMIKENMEEHRWVEILGFKLYPNDIITLEDSRRYVAFAWKRFHDDSDMVFDETYLAML